MPAHRTTQTVLLAVDTKRQAAKLKTTTDMKSKIHYCDLDDVDKIISTGVRFSSHNDYLYTATTTPVPLGALVTGLLSTRQFLLRYISGNRYNHCKSNLQPTTSMVHSLLTNATDSNPGIKRRLNLRKNYYLKLAYPCEEKRYQLSGKDYSYVQSMQYYFLTSSLHCTSKYYVDNFKPTNLDKNFICKPSQIQLLQSLILHHSLNNMKHHKEVRQKPELPGFRYIDLSDIIGTRANKL